MATILLSADETENPFEVIAARYQVESAPDGNTTVIDTRFAGIVRTYVAYAGAVTSCRLRLWYKNRATGTWHRGPSSDDISALTPAGGNDVRDWNVGKGQQVAFTVESIAPGTATNTVRVHVSGSEPA